MQWGFRVLLQIRLQWSRENSTRLGRVALTVDLFDCLRVRARSMRTARERYRYQTHVTVFA